MSKFALATAIALVLATPALAQEAATATATFTDQNGKDAGSVTLTQGADGVTLDGTITTVIPGAHGLHLSQSGNCDSSSAEATNTAGDWINLGTVQADGQGNVRVELTTSDVSLTDGEAGFALDQDGSALILDNGENNTSANEDAGTADQSATDASTTDSATTTTETSADSGSATDSAASTSTDGAATSDATEASSGGAETGDEATPATSSGEPVLCAVIQAGAVQ